MITENKIWKENYPIRFYHVKDSKTVCPTLLCDFMQDSAVNHIEALGHSLDRLQEENHGWVLSKMILKLNKLPKWKEVVDIETWQPGIDRLYALRDYILRDNLGCEIGRATSFWLAVDMNRNRLIRPETYLNNSVFIKDYRAIDSIANKLPGVVTKDMEVCFVVHSNNLDLNGHTNSIIYLKWIFKILKDLVPVNYTISEIEVNYNNQSFHGDKIHLYSDIKVVDDICITNHSLVRHSNGDNICNVEIKHRVI